MDPFNPNSRFGKSGHFAPERDTTPLPIKPSSQEVPSAALAPADSFNQNATRTNQKPTTGLNSPIRPLPPASSGKLRSGVTLQGGFSRLPASVQKALTAKKAKDGLQQTSSSDEADHSSSSRSSIDIAPYNEMYGPLGTDTLASQEKHARASERSALKNYILNQDANQLAGHRAFRTHLQASPDLAASPNPHALNPYIERPSTLPGHQIEATGDYIKPGTQVFLRVAWKTNLHLETEYRKHPELRKQFMLDAIKELATSTTGSHIQAFIYKNSHQSSTPTHSRKSGDVLFIDENKGIMAAFSRSGTIKTARIDNPVALRAYLQSEKYKDIDRNDKASSGSD